MQIQKKRWIRPRVVAIEIARARELLNEALTLIQGDSELEEERSELRSVLDALDKLA